MEQFKQKIDEKTGEEKSELQKQWQNLQDKKGTLQDDLKELKEKSAENWQDLKKDIDDQLDSLNNSFRSLKDSLGIS